MNRWLALAASLIAVVLSGCVHRAPAERAVRPFNPATDSFAFANETVWKYEDGRPVPRGRAGETSGDRYTHHCFVMARAAVQFWKFARFDPAQPPPPMPELERAIQRVIDRGVWRPPLPGAERIVVPGFASLRELSERHPDVVRAHIGESWPTYLRPGNFLLAIPPSAGHRRRTCRFLSASLAQNTPVALWLHNFPRVNMNHCVVACGQREEGGRTIFTVYDPNYTDGPRLLAFDHDARRFFMEKTFYFPGGPVRVRPVFVNRFE